MKSQALFSLKDKSKKLKYHLLLFLFGTLRIKVCGSVWYIIIFFLPLLQRETTFVTSCLLHWAMKLFERGNRGGIDENVKIIFLISQ